jgi:hypothetical protein
MVVTGRRGIITIHPEDVADVYYALEDLLRHVNHVYALDMEKPHSRLEALADAAGAALRRAHNNP